MVSSLGNRKILLGLSLDNRVDGAQRMSDVFPDKCGSVDEEQRVSQHIVVVQHLSLVFPQFRPLPVHSIPPMH